MRVCVLALSLLLCVAPSGATEKSTVSHKSNNTFKPVIQKHHPKRIAKKSKARKSKSKVAQEKLSKSTKGTANETIRYAGGYGLSYGSSYGSKRSADPGRYWIKPAFGNFAWAKGRMEELSNRAKKQRK